MPTMGNAEVSSMRASISVPGGSSPRVSSMARLHNCSARGMSSCQPKTRSSCAPPRVVSERMVSTPRMPATAFSSGRVTRGECLLDRQVAGARDER